MIKRSHWRLHLSVLLLLLTCLVACGGGSPSEAGSAARSGDAGEPVTLHAAWDVLPLGTALVDEGLPVTLGVSRAAVADLRAKKCDVAILGREPTAQEREGLVDRVVGYDAVCILIDENSYVGGIYETQQTGPLARTEGLQQLTTDEVRHIFANLYRVAKHTGDYWYWEGYERFEPVRDPETGDTRTDAAGEPIHDWVLNPKLIHIRFVFSPGRFDTQGAACQALGLKETDLAEAFPSYRTSPSLDTEEDVLSREYDRQSGPYSVGSLDFPFKVGYASRRAVTRAFNASVALPIAVVAVDGIDPTTNVGAVYDGSYTLRRRIHVLTRETGRQGAEDLADLLLSPEGQELVAAAGFLALPDAP